MSTGGIEMGEMRFDISEQQLNVSRFEASENIQTFQEQKYHDFSS